MDFDQEASSDESFDGEVSAEQQEVAFDEPLEPAAEEEQAEEPAAEVEEPVAEAEEPAAELPPVIIRAAGDAVRSADITVAGKHFVDWFNQDLRPAHPGKHPTARPHGAPIDHFGADVNQAGFLETFRDCARIYGARLSFHQFIGMFCVLYNETGGRLRLVSEGDYLPLEKRLRAAMRYNTAPNRIAGQQLAERGLLHDPAEIAAWSSTRYAGPSADDPDPDRRALFEAAQECDFFKYRGRGLNQLTWRPYITMITDPLLAAAGYRKTCDELTERELTRAIETDPRIGYGMTRSYFTRSEFLGAHFAALDQDAPDWRRVGRAVSGDRSEHGYAEIYAWRCDTLRAAMNEAGWQAD